MLDKRVMVGNKMQRQRLNPVTHARWEEEWTELGMVKRKKKDDSKVESSLLFWSKRPLNYLN